MRCVVLLRGINVGGKNTVPMAALKQVMADTGFTKVGTLLQSGNVVLETPLSEEKTLLAAQEAFTAHFGFRCGMLLRKTEQINTLVAEQPFSVEEIACAEAADPVVAHRYVYFLASAPDRKRLASLTDSEDLAAAGVREISLLCTQSIRLSRTAERLAAAYPDATVRNWNTVVKIAELI